MPLKKPITDHNQQHFLHQLAVVFSGHNISIIEHLSEHKSSIIEHLSDGAWPRHIYL